MKQRTHKIVMIVTFDKPIFRSNAIAAARTCLGSGEYYPYSYLGADVMRIKGFKSRAIDCAPKGRSSKQASHDTPEFTLPWHTAPSWAQWAAMDKDRTWGWYEYAPNIPCNYTDWMPQRGTHVRGFFAPPYPGDWKDSLQQRPEGT